MRRKAGDDVEGFVRDFGGQGRTRGGRGGAGRRLMLMLSFMRSHGRRNAETGWSVRVEGRLSAAGGRRPSNLSTSLMGGGEREEAATVGS